VTDEGGNGWWTGAAPPGRLRSAAGSRLTALLLSYRLLQGAPRVYFRRFVDKVEAIEGVERVDVSAKNEPVEVTPEEAIDALKRAGRALADAKISEGRVHTVYSRSALAQDLLIAIRFLNVQRPQRRTRTLFILTILRNLRYAIPGLGTAAIRRAEYIPWEDDDESCLLSIRQFGRALRDNSTMIVLRPTKIDIAAHNQLVDQIDGLDAEGEDDLPVIVEDQIAYLQVLMSELTTPVEESRSLERHFSGYVVLVASLLGVAVLGPWQELATRSAGLIYFTPSLLLLLITNSTLCSIIAHIAANYLNDQIVATAKTYAKATTIILALATLILTAGLAAGSRQGMLVIPGFVIYILILMTSLSADNLVFQAEARIKVLANRSKNAF
jgi:hypothetical protein